MANTSSTSIFSAGTYTVNANYVKDLNFFDLTGSKAKTQGSSSKFYHIELHTPTSPNQTQAQLYTEYGPTGKVQAREYRVFNTEAEAKKEFDKIIKSKLKKGYMEVDVAIRVVGSDIAKTITKLVVFKNAQDITQTPNNDPKLSTQVAALIAKLMGSTNQFVIETLKCPLGSLTNAQCDAGKLRLHEAKAIITSQQIDKKRIEQLTNEFYSLIPHNLGSGYRGVMSELLLDSVDKIAKKEYDLDTLLDAKALGVNLVSDSTYTQYQSLQTDISYIEPSDPLFNWCNSMIQDTRASNHSHLGKIVLLNAYKINRAGEKDIFNKRTREIAKECGQQVIPHQLKKLVADRNDVEDVDMYKNANVMPLFHGSRTENFTGILKKGLLIRPSGVVLCGSMYGNGIYAGLSTKSINYTSIKNSYWSKGSSDSAFLFIKDCALGNQKIATGSNQYSKKNISPNHSVWAKGGQSGVINDEFILYDTNQHNLRYLLEFTCK